MKRPSTFLFVIALFILAGFTSNASAMYHPGLGQWISRDPLGFVDGHNTYQMAKSAPTGLVDPSGLRVIIVECGTEKGKDKEAPFDDYSKTVDAMIDKLKPVTEELFKNIRDAGNVEFGSVKFKQGDKGHETLADFKKLLDREKTSKVIGFFSGNAEALKKEAQKWADSNDQPFDYVVVGAHGHYEDGGKGVCVRTNQINVNGDLVNQDNLVKELNKIVTGGKGHGFVVSCFSEGGKDPREESYQGSAVDDPVVTLIPNAKRNEYDPIKCKITFSTKAVEKQYGLPVSKMKVPE